MIEFLSELFVAIANVKALAGYADAFASKIVAWYMQNASNNQKMDMANSLILFANAKTDEEAFAAEDAVHAAMQRTRYVP